MICPTCSSSFVEESKSFTFKGWNRLFVCSNRLCPALKWNLYGNKVVVCRNKVVEYLISFPIQNECMSVSGYGHGKGSFLDLDSRRGPVTFLAKFIRDEFRNTLPNEPMKFEYTPISAKNLRDSSRRIIDQYLDLERMEKMMVFT